MSADSAVILTLIGCLGDVFPDWIEYLACKRVLDQHVFLQVPILLHRYAAFCRVLLVSNTRGDQRSAIIGYKAALFDLYKRCG